MNRIYLTINQPANFNFTQSKESFFVDEVIKYKLLKRGNFRLFRVKKVQKSTIELIEYLSQVLKVSPKEFGYAGLKDKNATTWQYMTVSKDISLTKFKNSNEVHIQELGFVANRLKIGELKGNRFKIILNNVDEYNYALTKSALQKISKVGFANFFGYQRFGALDDATAKGQKIADIGKKAKTQKAKIILAAYQAKYFNLWLNYRLEVSKKLSRGKEVKNLQLSPALINTIAQTNSLFKLLPGDLGYSLRGGRKSFEIVNDINKYTTSFIQRKFKPTGVLFGSDVRFANSVAGKIEREYIDYNFNALRGARRDAWVWAKDIKCSYDTTNQSATLEFFLPPGSYATVVLEEIANKKM